MLGSFLNLVLRINQISFGFVAEGSTLECSMKVKEPILRERHPYDEFWNGQN